MRRPTKSDDGSDVMPTSSFDTSDADTACVGFVSHLDADPSKSTRIGRKVARRRRLDRMTILFSTLVVIYVIAFFGWFLSIFIFPEFDIPTSTDEACLTWSGSVPADASVVTLVSVPADDTIEVRRNGIVETIRLASVDSSDGDDNPSYDTTEVWKTGALYYVLPSSDDAFWVWSEPNLAGSSDLMNAQVLAICSSTAHAVDDDYGQYVLRFVPSD